MIKPKTKDLRILGLIWTAICFGIGFYPAIDGNDLPIIPLILGFVLLLVSLHFPASLKWLYVVWVKLGEFIGAIVSRIILAIVFFIIVSPIGIVMRIAGKDTMKRKYDKSLKTYWIARLEQPGTLKNQY